MFDICAGDGEEDRYFFTRKEAKYQNGTRANRATSSGYWKATGSDKRITCPKRSKDTMGLRKTLVFHTGKPPGGSRTDWIMHEYRLVKSGTTSCNNSTKVALYSYLTNDAITKNDHRTDIVKTNSFEIIFDSQQNKIHKRTKQRRF